MVRRLAILFLVYSLLNGVRVLSIGYRNLGSLYWLQGVVQVEPIADARLCYSNSRYDTLREVPLQQALKLHKRAVELSPNDQIARQHLILTHYLLQDVVEAEAVLVDGPLSYENPILALQVLCLLNQVSNEDELVRAYKESRVPVSVIPQNIRDALASFYLGEAKGAQSQGDYEAESRTLSEILKLRPGDLYALYHLCRLPAGTEYGAACNRDLLTHPIQYHAINSTEEAVIGFAAEIIPNLVSASRWSEQDALEVAAFLSTRYSSNSDLETMVRKLSQRFGDNPNWSFLLGQVYYQQGEWARAIEAFRETVDRDKSYHRALLQLGRALEAGCRDDACLQRAVDVYQRYYEGTKDVYALKLLAELYDIHNPDSPNLWQQRLMEAIAAAEPTYSLTENGTRASEWQLLGYDLDEQMALWGYPVQLQLYWRTSSSVPLSENEDVLCALNGKCVQFVDGGSNLLLNGGFELGIQDRLPVGFVRVCCGRDAASHVSLLPTAESNSMTVVRLDTNDGQVRTRIESKTIEVDTDHIYLVSAWVRSIDPAGSMAYRWTGTNPSDGRSYTYFVSEEETIGWQHYATIVSPPLWADGMQIWLTDVVENTQSFFDRITVFEFRPPISMKGVR
jgi:tetratricopeptide (TPR) repeat protein